MPFKQDFLGLLIFALGFLMAMVLWPGAFEYEAPEYNQSEVEEMNQSIFEIMDRSTSPCLRSDDVAALFEDSELAERQLERMADSGRIEKEWRGHQGLFGGNRYACYVLEN